MKTPKNLLLLCIALILSVSPIVARASTHGMGGSAAFLVAPDIHTDAERIAELEQKVADAKGSADNAWMLVSAALVLLMTGPGLALFYGGLVRKKNVLATMLQSFAMMSLITILWGLFGYSLAFGSGNSFIGGFEYVFLRGVGGEPNASYAATIPQLTFMIYQLMFAVITPALITGAFAERMKFKAMLAFMALWSVVVYSPMAHMVWGKGGLLRFSRWRISHAGFRGRDRCACDFGGIGACLRALPR
jgi:Amt family ammonium transporter